MKSNFILNYFFSLKKIRKFKNCRGIRVLKKFQLSVIFKNLFFIGENYIESLNYLETNFLTRNKQFKV